MLSRGSFLSSRYGPENVLATSASDFQRSSIRSVEIRNIILNKTTQFRNQNYTESAVAKKESARVVMPKVRHSSMTELPEQEAIEPTLYKKLP